MKKEIKKLNPYSKRNRLNFRVDNEEMQTIFTKALLYADGDVSVYLRMAALGYKPYTKMKVGK